MKFLLRCNGLDSSIRLGDSECNPDLSSFTALPEPLSFCCLHFLPVVFNPQNIHVLGEDTSKRGRDALFPDPFR